MANDKDKDQLRHGAILGATAGASVGAAIMGAVLLGVDAYDDPLSDAVKHNKVVNIQPDQLADEIATNPKLQARWKAIREFVQRIDQQVGKNLKQSNWESRISTPSKPGMPEIGVD